MAGLPTLDAPPSAEMFRRRQCGAIVVGSLLNLSQLLTTKEGGEDQHAILIHMASKQLIDEIEAQRQLMEAENGQLDVHFSTNHSLDNLKQSIGHLKEYLKLHNINLRMAHESTNMEAPLSNPPRIRGPASE